MSTPAPRPDVETEQEYRAIETALLANARGRWFLAEHGRRARRVDSAMLEDAIGRLQTSLRQPPALLGQLQGEIHELRVFLLEAREQLLAKPVASAAAEGVETPINGILGAAELMHELAWGLQENAFDAEACKSIAGYAAKIYALSQQQAIESERTRVTSEAIDRAVSRLAGMLETIVHESAVDDRASEPGEVFALRSLMEETAAPCEIARAKA